MLRDRASGQQNESTVATVLAAVPVEERLILPCLQRIQQSFGYIKDEWLDSVAQFLNVSRAEVVGVMSYYHDLRRDPPPAVAVGVCVAEACQAQGVRPLWKAIESEAHSPSVEFSKVYCFGNCALGPAAMVNGRLIGRCDLPAIKAAVDRALAGGA